MSINEVIVYLERLRREYNEKAALLIDMQNNETVQPIRDELYYEEKLKSSEEEIRKLKEENLYYVKDIQFLKDLVKRLNKELTRYIKQLGPFPEGSLVEDSDDSQRELNRTSIYKINSLVVAYDEVIREQNASLLELRKQYELSLERMRTLQEENEEAYKYVAALNAQPDIDGKAKHIMADAKLLLEERELLLREVSLLKGKNRQMETDSKDRISKLQSHFNGSKAKVRTLKEQLEKEAKKILELQTENESMKHEIRNSVQEEDHQHAIDQCSKFLEKLKSVHKEETLRMKNEVEEIKSSQQKLSEMFSQSSKRFQGVKKENIGYKVHLRKNHSMLSQQTNTIKSLQKSRKLLVNKLRNLTRIMSELIEDRKVLLQNLQHCREEAARCSQLCQCRSVALGRMTMKMKEANLLYAGKLRESEGKLEAAQMAWNRALAETQTLKKLLQERDFDYKQLDKRFLN